MYVNEEILRNEIFSADIKRAAFPAKTALLILIIVFILFPLLLI